MVVAVVFQGMAIFMSFAVSNEHLKAKVKRARQANAMAARVELSLFLPFPLPPLLVKPNKMSSRGEGILKPGILI